MSKAANSCRGRRGDGPRAALSDAAWLRDAEIARLLALLDRDGEEARVVGGAVRNALMGLPVGEIDVATTALPHEVDAPRRSGGL